jgi:hypothetical protein
MLYRESRRADGRASVVSRWCGPRLFRRWRLSILSLVVLLVLAIPDLVLACPNCKDTLAEGGANAMNLVRGYFWSILFMMSMPFLILGSLISYFYYEVCKARASQGAGPPQSPPPTNGRFVPGNDAALATSAK